MKHQSQLKYEWGRLIAEFAPISNGNWQLNFEADQSYPTQGWKIHIAATILNANTVFSRVASFLTEIGVQFKVPADLDFLQRLNSGVVYPYSQVGKFITVYSRSDNEARELAFELDRLTRGLSTIRVPYDMQLCPDSTVFYRYGAYVASFGKSAAFVASPDGLVPDNKLEPHPEWVSNPLQSDRGTPEIHSPLSQRYGVFSALKKRGKGGAYLAVDFGRENFSTVVIKEGRKYGDLNWNGQDGRSLVMNELNFLRHAGCRHLPIPQLIDSFEFDGAIYLVLERIEGTTLMEILSKRKRRLPLWRVCSVLDQVAALLEGFNRAGWVWGDCKPDNLIFADDSTFRPIDFETSHRLSEKPVFTWESSAFSDPLTNDEYPSMRDVVALGKLAYFLVFGRPYGQETDGTRISRRNVPNDLIGLIDDLIGRRESSFESVRIRLRKLITGLRVSRIAEVD